MRWSVGIEAEGDRVLSREEVVELADAVAASAGIATGIGTTRYGARLVVQAGRRDEAIEKATEEFGRAVAKAGLPSWPITRTDVVGEAEDQDQDEDLEQDHDQDEDLEQDHDQDEDLEQDHDPGGGG